jgi:5-methylcytosine-specific restriction endonuclease McrA
MRPLSKGNGPGYNPPATVSWNRFHNGNQTAAYTALTTVFNIMPGPSPLVLNVADCLQKVLDINLGLVTGPYTTPARAAIMDKVSEIYKQASGPLVDAVGAFCAFCETSIPGLVEVEHVANKAVYPTYMDKWENFVPTCGACNTAKSNNPARATVGGWIPPIDPNYNNDLVFYQRIRNHYAWPDYWNDAFQFFWLDFQMSEDDGVTWQSLSYSDAVDLQDNYLARFDLRQRKVWADLRHNGVLYWGVLVRVQVQPTDENLVELCKLNKNEAGPATYDRRAFNRTLAWFSALDILRPLMQIDNEQQFLQLWPIIHYSSAAFGFWSLWATILSQFSDFDTPSQSLGWWLYNDTAAPNFYPGTNTSNIQLPPRQ